MPTVLINNENVRYPNEDKKDTNYIRMKKIQMRAIKKFPFLTVFVVLKIPISAVWRGDANPDV